MRPIGGVAQIGLKGHSYVLPIDTVESAATLVTSLPREDLSRHVMVAFMGTREVYKLEKEMARRLGPLSINPANVFIWLFFLKEVGNPYYINIDIPDTVEKRGNAAQNMLQHRAEVLDCADICNSATVLGLDKAQRSELEDAATGVDDEDVDVGIRVDHTPNRRCRCRLPAPAPGAGYRHRHRHHESNRHRHRHRHLWLGAGNRHRHRHPESNRHRHRHRHLITGTGTGTGTV